MGRTNCRRRRIDSHAAVLSAAAVIALIALVVVIGVVRSHDESTPPDFGSVVHSARPQIDPVVRQPAFADPPPRRFFRHSVVPGGVLSAAELRHSMRADPIVRAHYEGMDAERIVPFRLASELPAYVSYRVKNRTYWTTKKVNLQRGELILSDGAQWVRGRCGNLISFVPQKPFLPPAEEPRPAEFDVATIGLVPLVSEESGGGTTAVPVGDLAAPPPEQPTLPPLTLEITQSGHRRLLALPLLAAIPAVATIARAGNDPKPASDDISSPVPWEPNGLLLVGMFAAANLVSPGLKRWLFRRH